MPRRPLTNFETAEAHLVFGDGMAYPRASVFENTRLPNLVDDLGAALQGRKRTGHNAITLGNTSYFPVFLQTAPEAVAAGQLDNMCWLIHELTHQWQYQHLGWRYLFLAVMVQLRQGRKSYDYQGSHPSREAALQAARDAGRTLADFNMEQQGDIARDYYLRLKLGQDTSAWQPYVSAFRR